MNKKSKQVLLKFLPYLVIFSLSVFLSLSKTSGWIISRLEMTKLRRAFNASKTLVDYFPDIGRWFSDLDKNGVSGFSLNYILPAPLLYFFDEEIGFKIFFAIFGGLNACFVYFFINKVFRPKNKKEKLALLLSPLILVFSYGFSVLSGLCLMDPSMVFFLLLSLYLFYQKKYFLFGLALTTGVFCKNPILAIVPGLFLYLLLFRRKLLLKKELWLAAIAGQGLRGLVNWLQGETFNLQNFFPKPPVYLLDQLHFNHLKNVFLTAPVLVLFGILGFFNLTDKEREKLRPVFFSFFSLGILYFSAYTNGSHYIYFLFPFLAIPAYGFLRKISLREMVILLLLSIAVFVISYQEEPIYHRFHKKNLPQLKKIFQENLKEGEIVLTHPGVWDYYFGEGLYSVTKDIEWFGSPYITQADIPEYRIEQAGIIILEKPLINDLAQWEYFDQFQFKKEIDHWYVFVRRR